MVGATKAEIEMTRRYFPQYRHHLAMTPRSALSGVLVDEYVWTPTALALPARVRLRLRGMLAPLIDERSVEECFPDTLL
jgi:hypothetical protein